MNPLAVACILTAGLTCCYGAEYSVQTWDVDDGLPESGITDMVQSRDGYLWVSTLNSGVTRFDGVRFVNFEPPASLSDSRGIRRLFADRDGTLWMNGYGNYLACLRAGKFQSEYTEPVVVNWLVWEEAGHAVFDTKEGHLLERTPEGGTNSIWKVITAPGAGAGERFFADTQGNFWYRGTNGGLFRLVDDKAEVVCPTDGNSQINVLTSDRNGTIAVGTTQKFLLWNGASFDDATPTNGEPDIDVRGLVSDGQGGWWVDVDGRLRRCHDRKWVAEAMDWRRQKRTWTRVRWEGADFSGGFWMAYIDGGIVHISGTGKLSAITTREGLPSNRVRTLTLDREGNVWASFESGGLVSIRPRLFQAIGSRDGLSDVVTTSVCEDNHGAIWIGTLGGTVSRWDHGTCTNFTLPPAGTHSEMATVYSDKQGRIWIGTHGDGLLVYENGQFHNVLSTSQVGAHVRGLFVDDTGRVWIASQNGLFLYSDGKLEQLLAPKSESDYPTALAQGAQGKTWIAMNSGALGCYSDNHMNIFQPSDPAMRCRFAAVYEDARGAVWIGTLGSGLLRFRDGQFSALTMRDGLPTDYITQVLDDGAGRLWLGSRAGIISLQKSEAEQRLQGSGEELACHAYGRDDGLPTVGCAIASQPAAWRGQDGRLWFATSKGVIDVQPADAEIVQHPPWVVLEEIRVDGQPAPFPAAQNDSATAPSFLSSDRYDGAPIRLSPGKHQIEFRYTGLDFNGPERIRFKYMLKGLDSTWLESNERFVNYGNIPPGTYEFHVAAENSEGTWSVGDASLALIIPPHLWETRWFRLAAISAILISVAGSVFWILKLQHNRQLRVLEHRHALERERVRIAQDIHDDLGASLTRITMLSQSALNKSEPVKAPVAELSRIYHTARSMTNAMDEIVWAINPSNDTLENLTAYFAEFVQEFLTPLGVKFNLDMPLALPQWTIPSEIRHNLFLAFKEALNNVVKHSTATEVNIILKILDHGFVLSVEDNGCGFNGVATDGDKSEASRNARGNGLANMRRRLEEVGGYCLINSRSGSGTCVSLGVELKS